MTPPLPKRPIFTCEPDSFVVIDAEAAAGLLRHGDAEPWMTFRCAPGNIFESRPVRVLSHESSQVSVACADGTIIHLDFEEGTAHKTAREGEFVYRGSVEERNDGRGYLRLK